MLVTPIRGQAPVSYQLIKLHISCTRYILGVSIVGLDFLCNNTFITFCLDYLELVRIFE